MSSILIGLAVLTGLAATWLFHEVLNAPEGYEDDLGWHPGQDPDDFVAARHGRGGAAQ